MARPRKSQPAEQQPESKPAAPAAPAAPDVPPSGDSAVAAALAVVGKALAHRREVEQAKKDLDAAKNKVVELKTAYEAVQAKQQALETSILAQYPSAKALLEGNLPTGGKGKPGRKPGTVKRAASGKAGLTPDQAEQVLAAMGNTFTLGDFTKKLRELFPGIAGTGATKLLGDKVKPAGGAGMGRKFKKS